MAEQKRKKEGNTEMIQDIAPHRYDNTYKHVTPGQEDFVMFCRGEEILTGTCDNGALTFPTRGSMNCEETDLTYLFAIDDRRYFLCSDLSRVPESGYQWKNKRDLRRMAGDYEAFAAVTAIQLHHWYESRKFCGKCGNTMIRDTKERMLCCPSCGQTEYPKISPAVIVAVTDHDRLLLTKYAGRRYNNYALIAGFAEIGETIEETVHREVMEEVGLKVRELRYYKSQPWSVTETLLFGFYAQVDGDSQIVLDQTELAEATWFARDQIPVSPTGDSLTNEMIVRFMRGEDQ